MNRRMFVGLLPAAGTVLSAAEISGPVVVPAAELAGYEGTRLANLIHEKWRITKEIFELAPKSPWCGLFTTAEELAAVEFFGGAQWDHYVAQQRRAKGRPCLVFNLLPGLVAQITAGKDLSDRERLNLVVWTVRQTRDAQMLYNYYNSEIAELTMRGVRTRD